MQLQGQAQKQGGVSQLELKNIGIRTRAKNANVKLWEIGEQLGMNDSAFSRKLRKELDANTQQQIIAIIEKLEMVSGVVLGKEDSYASN